MGELEMLWTVAQPLISGDKCVVQCSKNTTGGECTSTIVLFHFRYLALYFVYHQSQ